MSWQKLFILLADYILSSSPSSFPSFPLRNFPEKNQEKKQKLLPLPSPHTLKILSIFSLLFSLFSSPSGAGFPLLKKGRNSLEPSVSKGLERIRERRRKKILLGWMALGDGGLRGRMGKIGGRGRGKGRTLGIGAPQGPLFALLFCFL